MWATNNPSKLWTPGRTLTIAFLNGTQEAKDIIIAAASNWLPHINLNFDFVEGHAGDIRIRCDGGAFFSAVGTDALLHDEGATMQLGSDLADRPRFFAANVMHEFGHMLGAEHEQTHPLADIPWDLSTIYESHGLTDDPDEDDELTRSKRDWLHDLYIDCADREDSIYSDYDRKSVMHYFIPQSWTKGDFQNLLNLELSDNDKAFMAKAYPYPV